MSFLFADNFFEYVIIILVISYEEKENAKENNIFFYFCDYDMFIYLFRNKKL